MNIFNRRSLPLLAGLLLVAGVIAIFQWDAGKRVAHFEELMESQGRAMADIVAERAPICIERATWSGGFLRTQSRL